MEVSLDCRQHAHSKSWGKWSVLSCRFTLVVVVTHGDRSRFTVRLRRWDSRRRPISFVVVEDDHDMAEGWDALQHVAAWAVALVIQRRVGIY